MVVLPSVKRFMTPVFASIVATASLEEVQNNGVVMAPDTVGGLSVVPSWPVRDAGLKVSVWAIGVGGSGVVPSDTV